MSWSLKRKLLYFLSVLFFIVGIGFYFSYPLIFKSPTCSDGEKNGLEEGIDCGGSCQIVCPLSAKPVSILWARAFPVAPGIYDAVAYIENTNVFAGTEKLLYRLKVYDEKNILIATRDGRTYLGPNQSTAIFESGIKTGELIPKRVFLELEEGYIWTKTDRRFEKVVLSVKNKNLDNTSASPKLSATIRNESLYSLPNVEVIAILRDGSGNALGVSKTIIDRLLRSSSEEVTFTWLSPFPAIPAIIEIIPRVNPFTVDFK